MILMKKDIVVADISFDERGYIIDINKIYDIKNFPLNVYKGKLSKEDDIDRLNAWWKNNSIPIQRDSIRLALECLGVNTPEELKVIGKGVSLLNQYWIKEEKEDISWKDINYYDNPFSKAIGEALFNHKPIHSSIFDCGSSPDNGINGMLKKRWIIKENNYYLQKSGTGLNKEEVFNEILASEICNRANIINANYEFYMDINNQDISCISKCFTDKDTELIPFTQIIDIVPRRQGYPFQTELEHLYNICEYLKVPDYKEYLNNILCLDYILAGTDRHYNNLALLYNAKNNCFKFSPVFDSGNCLWNGKMTKFIDINDDSLMARPICNKNTFGNWNEQKQYITGYINITSNDLIESIYKYIELTYKYSELKIDRISLIANGVLKRAYNLQQLLLSKNINIDDKNMINENDFRKLQNISINNKTHIILDNNNDIINEIIKNNENKDRD